MDIARLREATTADHEQVEGSLPLMDPMLDRAAYAAVLRRMYGVVGAWEGYASTHAPSWMEDVVKERSRLKLLASDLRVMGVTVPPASELPRLPSFVGTSGLLGGMYVMEGSRLGGQLIARHVSGVLDLRPGEGEAYFRGYGERTGGMWKELVQFIETHVPDAEADDAIRGAQQMFRCFGDWMRIGTLLTANPDHTGSDKRDESQHATT